jgi:N-(2-amino-2-carboxyethyl)-L-glutamate synthase
MLGAAQPDSCDDQEIGSFIMDVTSIPHRISLPVGNTPIVQLDLNVNGVERLLGLKLEAYNPCGSLKDRVAQGLIDEVADQVHREVGIIESTSGNLGVAMAAICNQRGINFNAVVDPHASPLLIERMRRLGSVVTIIDEPDPSGGYLMNRLQYVRGQLAARPGLVWTNQYESDENPKAHSLSTAPELLRQVSGSTTVFVPVSTGGTLAGFSRFAEAKNLAWRLIGVDVAGSAALGATAGPRVLSGIGASRPSYFLNLDKVESVYVHAAEAISACMWLADCAGVDVGGSSGATVAAALRVLRSDPQLCDLVCICPDGADRYLTTIYQLDWREAHGVTSVQVAKGIELLNVRYIA